MAYKRWESAMVHLHTSKTEAIKSHMNEGFCHRATRGRPETAVMLPYLVRLAERSMPRILVWVLQNKHAEPCPLITRPAQIASTQYHVEFF